VLFTLNKKSGIPPDMGGYSFPFVFLTKNEYGLFCSRPTHYQVNLAHLPLSILDTVISNIPYSFRAIYKLSDLNSEARITALLLLQIFLLFAARISRSSACPASPDVLGQGMLAGSFRGTTILPLKGDLFLKKTLRIIIIQKSHRPLNSLPT
jgi:hypothetical protein